MMLNFKCTESYFTVLPCMLFYLKCVLCITIIMCFVSNDEIKMFNQSSEATGRCESNVNSDGKATLSLLHMIDVTIM